MFVKKIPFCSLGFFFGLIKFQEGKEWIKGSQLYIILSICLALLRDEFYKNCAWHGEVISKVGNL
jgi:hypothetical protein